jgi:hypothetical protein
MCVGLYVCVKGNFSGKENLKLEIYERDQRCEKTLFPVVGFSDFPFKQVAENASTITMEVQVPETQVKTTTIVMTSVYDNIWFQKS